MLYLEETLGGYIMLFDSLQDLNYQFILTVFTRFNPSDDQYQIVQSSVLSIRLKWNNNLSISAYIQGEKTLVC